ncbi:LysR family transcriptional regulator [Paraburkholderia susongensis]|uniref:DNA-binding transcriptional regulator, LysR family n=1 Tax=Paraburkholderia susongensis TaxID=1515439 RepID=A0A1X7JG62_9BURK|nr:LysR family transcriptional regulator [Paraburkholderia susongensis]SMG26724.1 DNA-binding transcriptional regulator, LysR family [Paraburkholderia susongensis]
MNISSVDLNLLKVFDAIYVERSVSRAAVRLGLTQPSVSHGLTRLRTLFADPLFVRLHGGVEPTIAAMRIAPVVQQVMRNLQTMFDEGSRFDPATGRRTFLIQMSDFGEVTFLPPLVRELQARAPGVRIETCQLAGMELTQALESGQIDFAIGHLPVLDELFQSEPLFGEQYVLLAPPDPASKPPKTRPLEALEFVCVTSHPETTKILVELGLQERVKLAVPHFMVLPAIFEETGLAAVLPRRVGEYFGQTVGKGRYREIELPGPGLSMNINLYWFRRYSTEPGNIWLRELIVELFKHSSAQRKSQGRKTGQSRATDTTFR